MYNIVEKASQLPRVKQLVAQTFIVMGMLFCGNDFEQKTTS